jgi:hypothetical protein
MRPWQRRAARALLHLAVVPVRGAQSPSVLKARRLVAAASGAANGPDEREPHGPGR